MNKRRRKRSRKATLFSRYKQRHFGSGERFDQFVDAVCNKIFDDLAMRLCIPPEILKFNLNKGDWYVLGKSKKDKEIGKKR